ncbi:hypothetical protein GCM10009589_40540 [Arthrobacter pascens]
MWAGGKFDGGALTVEGGSKRLQGWLDVHVVLLGEVCLGAGILGVMGLPLRRAGLEVVPA